MSPTSSNASRLLDVSVATVDVAAIDYFVKPSDDERVELAVEHARRHIASREMDQLRAPKLALLQEENVPVTPASRAIATTALEVVAKAGSVFA
ncbi:MAG: hypothetical protein ABIT38_11260 [Gemmatimonadaceae bacterium]